MPTAEAAKDDAARFLFGVGGFDMQPEWIRNSSRCTRWFYRLSHLR